MAVWDNIGRDIHKHCKKSRNDQWYWIAYNNLVKYHKTLEEDPKNQIIITNIGLLLNCMVNNVYGVINNQKIIDNIQSNLTRGSKFHHDSKLEMKYTCKMSYILKHWIECFNKYYTYKFKR